ncbi:MAG: hypothetical protein ACKOAY_01180 [Haliscomenobacter sp.]
MTPFVHRIYIGTLSFIVIAVTIFLWIHGFEYYRTPIEDRFLHPDYAWFKPSGIFGHGLGIIGTLLILIGVFGYMALKRFRSLARFGRLKYWLEFHIFLCTLGPVMILFHTTFKFGGIVSVSFWSMVAVVASGVVGRFIYLQIPRSIEGRELSLQEVKAMKTNIEEVLRHTYQMQESSYQAILSSTTTSNHSGGSENMQRIIQKIKDDRQAIRKISETLRGEGLSRRDQKKILQLVRNEISLNNRIERLHTMQNLLKYWHIAHLPFALIMLVIMVIHVGITLLFGYHWIF